MWTSSVTRSRAMGLAADARAQNRLRYSKAISSVPFGMGSRVNRTVWVSSLSCSR